MKQRTFLALGLSVALTSSILAACSSDTSSPTAGKADAGAGGSSSGGAGGSTSSAGGKSSTGGTTGAGGKSTGGTTGAGGTDAGSTGGSTTDAGGTDAATQTDAAPPAECGSSVDAGSQCNALVNTGTDVTLTAATGTLPTGTGGTIEDGLYHLTQLLYYPGSSIAGQTLVTKQTVLVCGGGTTTQHVDDQGSKTTRKNGTISISGTRATFSNTCVNDPNPNIDWSSFTATSTGFTMYSTDLGAQAVFTK